MIGESNFLQQPLYVGTKRETDTNELTKQKLKDLENEPTAACTHFAIFKWITNKDLCRSLCYV